MARKVGYVGFAPDISAFEIAGAALPIQTGRGRKIRNLLGQRFGLWQVVAYFGKDKWNGSVWLCRCDCGTLKLQRRTCLTDGGSKSCGCKHGKLLHRGTAMKTQQAAIIAAIQHEATVSTPA